MSSIVPEAFLTPIKVPTNGVGHTEPVLQNPQQESELQEADHDNVHGGPATSMLQPTAMEATNSGLPKKFTQKYVHIY